MSESHSQSVTSDPPHTMASLTELIAKKLREHGGRWSVHYSVEDGWLADIAWGVESSGAFRSYAHAASGVGSTDLEALLTAARNAGWVK